MDITEQEAERIFNFIVKKLGSEYAYVKPIAISNSASWNWNLTNDTLILKAKKDHYNHYSVSFMNDTSIGRITGNSWTDMLKKVIRYNTKSDCYIFISLFCQFKMPKTLEELRIMVDLES